MILYRVQLSGLICYHAVSAEKNSVRFSAYRTSLKLRLLQKLLKRMFVNRLLNINLS